MIQWGKTISRMMIAADPMGINIKRDSTNVSQCWCSKPFQESRLLTVRVFTKICMIERSSLQSCQSLQTW